jgi:hypothetical protein
MDGREAARAANYTFFFRRASVATGEGPRTIRLDGLQLNLQFPKGGAEQAESKEKDAEPQGASISSTLDLQEGQKVVVGKTSFDSPQNALILVLTAKVLE